MIYREQGRLAEAEDQWRAGLSEQPDYAPAMLGLGEISLMHGRWEDREQFAQRLGQTPSGSMEAAVLRARGCLARQEFAAVSEGQL